MDFYMPVRLYTGSGCVQRQRRALTALGQRCLIVTGAHSARLCGALADVCAALDAGGIAWTVFDGIGPNPALSSCMEGGRRAHEAGADFILGVGGGSPLDAAKAVSVFAANPGLGEADFYARRWPHEPLPIALVGTTAGTGSEVTAVAVLTDSAGKKHSIRDDALYAAAAFGDARYTHTLPSAVTRATGVDALAHCIESYFKKEANEISRAASLRGIALLLQVLPHTGDALSPGQREQLYAASLLGGLAISVTGTAVPHNVGYCLTERYGLAHGFACAVFLPELLRRAAEAEPVYTQAFYAALQTTPEALEALIVSLLPPLEIRMSAADIASELPRWQNNATVRSTLGGFTAADIASMLTRRFGGAD